MTTTAENLLIEVLKLPVSERAELADRILSSVDPVESKNVEALWADEAESRIDAHDKGLIESIAEDQVFEGILDKG